MAQTRGEATPGLQRLRWAGIVLPMPFLGVVNYVAHYVIPSVVRSWWGFLLLNLVLLVAVAIFAYLIFTIISGWGRFAVLCHGKYCFKGEADVSCSRLTS
ncbi:MAG: hypothetical protein HYY31_01735 [Chloroflexi bacterium]|nr:hypothetical protein [Chloroflexota bacterium]